MDRYMSPGDGTEALIELSFYGRGLKNMDFLSKSDPFVVMYQGDQSSLQVEDFELIGQTETVWDNLNPDFVTKIYLPLATEQEKHVRILLQFYDQDQKDTVVPTPQNLAKQDFIGQAKFNVAELLGVEHRMLSMTLTNKKGVSEAKRGTAVVTAEEISNRQRAAEIVVEFRFTADCEMPRRKKIFIVLSRSVKYPSNLGPKWTPVYRTGTLDAPVKSGQEYGFQYFTLRHEQLNAMEDSRAIRLEMYFHKRSGAHTLQGFVELSLEDLRSVESDHMFPIQRGRDSNLNGGYVFQPGSLVSSDSAKLGLVSSLRFFFTRLTWK